MNATRAHFTERLRANAEKARANFERVAARHAEAQARGIDTSAFDPRTGGQSTDTTLAKAEGRWEQAARELEQYEAETARRENEESAR